MPRRNFAADLAVIREFVASLRDNEAEDVTVPAAVTNDSPAGPADDETYFDDARRALPGCNWSSMEEASAWFTAERRQRGWTVEEVSKRWETVAWASTHPDVHVIRPTAKQVTALEAGKFSDLQMFWLRWMPLVFAFHDLPDEDRAYWALENIPMHQEWLEILHSTEEGKHRPWLLDHELELLERVRSMNQEQLGILFELARAPEVLPTIAALIRKSANDLPATSSAG